MRIGIILSVVLTAFLLYALIRVLSRAHRDYVGRMNCVHLCETSLAFLEKEVSYLVSIQAEVGGGKTSLMSGLSHYETLILQKKASDYLEYVQVILPSIDYRHLNERIASLYGTLHKPLKVYEELWKETDVKDAFSGIYSDHVSEIPKAAILKNYIEAFTALQRNHFIGANYSIYNRLTENFSFFFDYESLEIKDEDVQKNYLLPKYCSIFEDESLLSIYKNTNSNSVIGDTGQDLSQRLIRHLGKETVRIYSSAQNILRISKLIRELGTSFINIESMEIVGQLTLKDRLLELREERLRKRLTSEKLLFPNKVKDKVNRIFDKRKKLFASNYLKYKITVYSSLEDVGKAPDKCAFAVKAFDLYFPITWCFGVYDPIEFKFIDEFLTALSNKTDLNLKVAKASLSDFEKETRAKAILKKVEPKAGGKDGKEDRRYADLG